MICRIWHGWTTVKNADAYEKLLKSEILPGIADKKISGYKGAHLLRKPVLEHDNEVEFVTLCWFESMDSVKEFAGEKYKESVVPLKARKLLSRHDDYSIHYRTVGIPK